jgi:hypothetical protein
MKRDKGEQGLKGNSVMYKVGNHRLQLLTQIIRLVTTMAPQQRIDELVHKI